MRLAVEGGSRALPGRKTVGVSDGSRGDFLVIVFALKQLTGFREGEESPVHGKFILASIFWNVEDGIDLVAVVAKKLNDEVGIDHCAYSCRIRMLATVHDGGRGNILLAGRVARGGDVWRADAFEDGSHAGLGYWPMEAMGVGPFLKQGGIWKAAGETGDWEKLVFWVVAMRTTVCMAGLPLAVVGAAGAGAGFLW